MKQMVSPEQMASLSPIAKERLNKWLKKKGYGSTQNGLFIPITQLNIGLLMEFLADDTETKTEPIDVLWKQVKDILEAKN